MPKTQCAPIISNAEFIAGLSFNSYPEIPELGIGCDAIIAENVYRYGYDGHSNKNYLEMVQRHHLYLSDAAVKHICKQLEVCTEALTEMISGMMITHPVSGEKFQVYDHEYDTVKWSMLLGYTAKLKLIKL